MPHPTREQFQEEFLQPAHRRCDELRAAIADAERELESLIQSRVYDDEAAEALQLRLEGLNRSLARWERRYYWLAGRLTVTTTPFVNVEAS